MLFSLIWTSNTFSFLLLNHRVSTKIIVAMHFSPIIYQDILCKTLFLMEMFFLSIPFKIQEKIEENDRITEKVTSLWNNAIFVLKILYIVLCCLSEIHQKCTSFWACVSHHNKEMSRKLHEKKTWFIFIFKTTHKEK